MTIRPLTTNRPLAVIAILTLVLSGCIGADNRSIGTAASGRTEAEQAAGETAPAPVTGSSGPGASSSSTPTGLPAGFDPSAVPPGCDPTRSAVAHHADGLPALFSSGITPCFHRLGQGSFEPTIGIASTGAVFVYPAAAHTIPDTIHVARSTDDGKSWDLFQPNVAGLATHPYSLDPYLYLDPMTDRLFVEDLDGRPTCGTLSFSDDLGETWTHTQSGCAQADHATIFAGKPVSSTTIGYPNIVYRCAISGGMLADLSSMVTCAASIDGGLTWLPPGGPAFTFVPGALAGVAPGACTGGNGHGAVGPDGTVYLPRGHCGQPFLAISHDEALTWTTVQVSNLGNACDGDFCEHDAGLAVDQAGNVYYAWITAERWLMLTHSTDAGLTWSTPLNITAPGLDEAAFVQMAAGGVGKIALAYMGTRTSPRPEFANYGQTTWDAYMAVSYDALATTPTFHSAMMNEPGNPLVRGQCLVKCGSTAGDFIDIRIAPDGTPWAPFVDGCFKACAKGGQEDGREGVTGRLWNGPSLWDTAAAAGSA